MSTFEGANGQSWTKELLVSLPDSNEQAGPSQPKRPRLKPPKTDYFVPPGFSNLNGQLYESKMLALVLLRLLHDPDVEWFLLGSNVPNFGSFDDIVLRVRRRRGLDEFWFVQLKHKNDKEKDKITVGQLQESEDNRNKYSFAYFCKTYEDIREKLQNQELQKGSFFEGDFQNSNVKLVFYTTNAEDILPGNEFIEASPLDDHDILKTNSTGRRLTFKKKCIELLTPAKPANDHLKLKEPKIKKQLTNLTQALQTHLDDFISKVFIYSGQAQQDEVDNVLLKEIEKLERNCKPQNLLKEYHELVQNYWKSEGNRQILDENCRYFKQAANIVKLSQLSDRCSNIIKNLGVEFSEHVLNHIKRTLSNLSKPIVVIRSNVPILTCAKMLNYFKKNNIGSNLIIDSKDIWADFNVYSAFAEERDYQQLIIKCNRHESIANKLKEIERTELGTKTVFLVCNQELIVELRNHSQVEVLNDQNNKLSDLSSICQERVLQSVVGFQGTQKKLIELVGPSEDRNQVPRDFVAGEIVLKLLNKEDCTIFETDHQQTPEVMSYYIDRSLSIRRTVTSDIVNQSGLFCIVPTNSVSSDENRDILVVSYDRDQFERVCRENEQLNVHWLVKSGDIYEWKESSKTLNSLRPFLGQSETKFMIQTVGDLRDSVTIIAAEPGMGKSTLLTSLDENAKHGGFGLMIRINLLDYITQFYEMKNTTIGYEQSLDFLTNLLKANFLKYNTKLPKSYVDGIARLQRSIFLNNMKIRRNILLVDGFDEIAPKYKQTVLNLLRSWKDHKFGQMLITTRSTNVLVELENCLACFAHSLEPLSSEDVDVLFAKRFREFHCNVSEAKLSYFVEHLIDHFHKNLAQFRQQDFFGIPLHCEMVATRFRQNFERFSLAGEDAQFGQFVDDGSISLASLFDRFIQDKFDFYLMDKCGQNLINPNFDRDTYWEHFQESHKRLAVRELFEGEALNVLQSRYDVERCARDLSYFREKEGIICQIVDGKPHFVHRTFAEYFSALVLLKKIMTSSGNEFELILRNVLLDDMVINDRQQLCLFVQLLVSENSSKILELKTKALSLLISLQAGGFNDKCSDLLLGIVDCAMPSNENYNETLKYHLMNQNVLEKQAIFSACARMGYLRLLRAFKTLFQDFYIRHNFITTRIETNPIWLAIEHGQIEVVKILLIEFGYSLTWMVNSEYTLLDHILDYAKFDTIKSLIIANIIDCAKSNNHIGSATYPPIIKLVKRKAPEDLLKFVLERSTLSRWLPFQSFRHLGQYSDGTFGMFLEKGVITFIDETMLGEMFSKLNLPDRIDLILVHGIGFNIDFLEKQCQQFECLVEFLLALFSFTEERQNDREKIMFKALLNRELFEDESYVSQVNTFYCPKFIERCNLLDVNRHDVVQSFDRILEIYDLELFEEPPEEILQLLKGIFLKGCLSTLVRIVREQEVCTAFDYQQIVRIKNTVDDCLNIVNLFKRLVEVIQTGCEDVQSLLNSIDERYKKTILNSQNIAYGSPLHFAALTGELEATESLLRHGANPNATLKINQHNTDLFELNNFFPTDDPSSYSESKECTPMHYAAAGGHLNIIQLLYQSGADLNANKFDTFEKPLHFAARNGHCHVVQYLLQQGVPPNPLDYEYQTPMWYALENHHTEIVRLLERVGGIVEEYSDLQQAALNNEVVEVRRLIELAGADPTPLSQPAGFSLLQLAVTGDARDVVQYLLERDSDPYRLIGHECQPGGNVPRTCEISRTLTEWVIGWLKVRY